MANPPTPPAPDAEPLSQADERLRKLHQIEALGIDPWGQAFPDREAICDIRARDPGYFDDANPAGPVVRAAGRVVRHRDQGKTHFLEIQDQSGRVQILANAKRLTATEWQVLKLLDLGDIVGVEGEFGQTKTHELTVRAAKLTFLTKSLEPHPKDTTGLTNVESRLRQRYLDLLYNHDALRKAEARVRIVRAIRTTLDARGFLEVETPVLQSVASGAAARPFETHHNALDIPLVLRIALELPLKRLLVGGMERVYELGRVFRNEGISPRHNPEFTMLELYEAYGDLTSMMAITEAVISAAAETVGFGGVQPPFARSEYADLFRQYVGCELFDAEGARAKALEHNVPVAGTDGTPKEHAVLVNDLFGLLVEDNLAGPVFVVNYPAELCPLTKRLKRDPRLAERFELYVRGMELANAYTELNDPITQEATFTRQLAGMSDDDSMAKLDVDFIRALRHGMPPAGGLGVGIDRLCMLLTDSPTIRDVVLFPLLRPLSGESAGEVDAPG